MKKIVIVTAIIIIFAFIFASCSQTADIPQTTPEATAITEEPVESGQTNAPEPETTLEPAVDPDPLGRLVTDASYMDDFYALWPLADSPMQDHGELVSYAVNMQNGFDLCSVNATFTSELSMDDMKAKYFELIQGEWMDDEYSAGPSIFDGNIGDVYNVTCQLSPEDGSSQVFLGLTLEDFNRTLVTLINENWPYGLIDMQEGMSDDTLFFYYLTYLPGDKIMLGKSWQLDETAAQQAFDAYAGLLADCDGYSYNPGGEYGSATINCNINDCGILVSYAKDLNTLDISISREMALPQ